MKEGARVQAIVRTKFLVVGSGANGISPAVALRERGENDFRIISKDSDFGGVWHVNRYPGCITDIPAVAYQLSYAKSYEWSASHPPAKEMAEYLRNVAAHYGLYAHADFGNELLSAEWLGDDLRWKVTTNAAVYKTKFLIISTGFLEQLKFPDLTGQDTFTGRLFHAAEWPEGYTGAGDRVAVLGTSASGVQIVPEMQKVADKVYVFQRTPVHLLPLNRAIYSPDELEKRRIDRTQVDAERREIINQFERLARASMFGGPRSETVAQMETTVNRHREAQVPDPALREKLTPNYPLGCKRPTRTDLYYGAIQQPNVELICEGAIGLERNCIIAESGPKYEVDTVVMATGYYWGGDILSRIRRRDGLSVADSQQGHRKAYKSVSLSGCPNLFLVGGAGANGAVWNGYAPGEIVPGYMMLVLDYMAAKGIEALEVIEAEERAWKQNADDMLSKAPIVAGGCVNYCLDQSGHDMANWPGVVEDMANAMKVFEPEHYMAVDHAMGPRQRQNMPCA